MEPRGPVDEGAAEPSLGRELLRAAAIGAQPVIEEFRGGVSFLVILAVFVPVGFGVLIASALVFGGIFAIVGAPSGTLGVLLGVGWLVLTFGALFLVFRALYRRLPRRIVNLAPDADETPDGAPANVSLAAPAARGTGRRREHSPSLAELDARLAPPKPRS